MPKTSLRLALALGAFFVVALLLAACGSSSSIPGNAVANVDGTPITKATFQRWLQISAKSAAASGAAVIVPDPPSYTNCIASLRKQQRPVKGQPAPSVTTLRAQCKAQDQQLTQQTMGTLIQTAWVEGEAKKQGVSASDAEVQKQFAITKKQSFPTVAAYNKFVQQTGMTQTEILERVKVQLLAQKITRKIQATANVTDAQVTRYYNTHRTQFAVPERRDLEVILTRSQAQAQAAKSAVQGGTSWKAAARKYSIDPTSKATGGVLRGVAKGQEDQALDKAAFSAPKGQLVGPVKGQFGWYIVRVNGITAPQQESLAQAKPQIKAFLVQQRSQQRMSAFIQSFQKRWKAKTRCRTGYVVQLCSNAPQPKTVSTAGGTVATTPSTTPGTTKTK
jgi:parvulin-like peptidyl-prolyl isomerase